MNFVENDERNVAALNMTSFDMMIEHQEEIACREDNDEDDARDECFRQGFEDLNYVPSFMR